MDVGVVVVGEVLDCGVMLDVYCLSLIVLLDVFGLFYF